MGGVSTWRKALLFGVLLVFVWQLGPWALLGLAAFSLRPLRPRRPWWVAGGGVLVLALVVGLLLVPQSGRLAIPSGIGQATSPGYEGRPASASPVDLEVPQHPHLAANGRNSMHNDAAASDAYDGPGPLGSSPTVDSAWYGIKECATLMFTRDGGLIGLCGDRTGPVLQVIDPDSLRLQVERRLPPRPKTGGSPLENICGGAYSYLDDRDRVLVAASDRSIKVFTSGLDPITSWSVAEAVPAADCLVALMPDWQGRVWFASKGGIVGFVDQRTGRLASRDLDEAVVNSLAADSRGVYVVSDRALYRFAARDGAVAQHWRTRYDRGSQQKPGQLSQGSGTTPTLLGDGLVAITDNADPRMHVVLIETDTGARRCSAPVFDDDASATENSLVSLGDAVLVENNHGYRGPWSTMLGRAPTGGIARVNSDCEVAWTNPVIAPTSVPKVSLDTGLLYVYEKRASWWGVNAWYLTAIDVRTGRTKFRVRTGIGTLFNNHYAAITLGPGGAAYIATLAGLVRVRDR